ncbi:beta-N-acetylhexosaminidase [Solitalea longa]|uniref:beta-N-acetylhexosaminidase n=1 Tax=Solitalea longa TaxID=2079460 RepID=A0A2S5A9H5_9SPHI|nr:family 20 glycosylhydrolase [Solitalea longa]POY38949.1 beta-N-acetylhexosaminidase [Solitalea longa]
MNKHVISLALFAGLCYSTNAQQVKHPLNPNDIKIKWGMMENNYKGQGKYFSVFTFINNSKHELPAKGWSIYFNLPRGIDTSVAYDRLKYEHVNGDLNRIVPTSGFIGLKPKIGMDLEMIASDWSLNRADAPSGLYFVWDDEPQTAIALTNYEIVASTKAVQINRTKTDIAPIATPEVVYNRNKVIEDIPANKLTKVFPTPLEYVENAGTFLLSASTTISADPDFSKEATYLSNELKVVLGKAPSISTSKGTIELRKAAMDKEAYTLSVSSSGIIITASTPAGAFYGIQSLKTLMPATAWSGNQKSVVVPGVEIKDAPRFGWRAFMLDVARNFQTKEEVLKTLDWLALYKINVFHFHCTEDEGWRIEIPGLPELTEVGGKRGHKNANIDQLPPSFTSGPDNSTAGSGFYTKADFIEILKYANDRHIKVIPEIESPGHARAAVQSMQVRYDRLIKQGQKAEAEKYLLRDLNDKSVHSSVQGWNDNVMDVSMPSTYTFIQKVVDELIATYKEAGVPLETIHMGGDEVPSGSWEKSPAFAKLQQENPAIKNTNDLWYYYYGKVNEIVKSKGLYLYGWEEVGMRKTMLDGAAHAIPNPDFAGQNVHLDVWNNVIGWGAEDLAYRLANAGYKVVLSPVSNLYFDMSYDKDFEEQGYYWGGFVDVDKPYSFIPFDYLKNTKQDKMGNTLASNFTQGKERLTDLGKTNIVGIQGLLFAETITSAERMEYMLMPKLLGLAERAWAKDPEWSTEKDEAKSNGLYAKAWSDFVNRIGKRELPRLSYYKGGLRYRIPTAGAIVENGMVRVNVQLPGFIVRYTTNGAEPTVTSKQYNAPFSDKGTIKLRVFDVKGRGGRTVEVLNK